MSEIMEDRASYPMARGRCPFDPPPELNRRQAEEPLARVKLWDGSTPWLVTRYDDSRQLLADPRISSDIRRRGFPVRQRGAGPAAEPVQRVHRS